MEFCGLVVKSTDLKFSKVFTFEINGNVLGRGLQMFGNILFIKLCDGHLLYYSLYL